MGAQSDSQLILVRFAGEVAIKARATRQYFLKRLSRNLKDALKSHGIRGRLIRTHDRLYIEGAGSKALAPVSRVFGIQSLALVEPRPWSSLDELVAIGVELTGDLLRGKRYAVRARRVGERARIGISAREVERRLGAALGPGSAGVDLSSPEVTVHLEIGPNRAYFYNDSLRGRGGLPVGVEGRAVALVSGGFDSAVAAWQLLKRGVSLDYVFCNLGGRSHQLGTFRVIKRLADNWSYGSRPRLHAIDFDLLAQDLRLHCDARYWQILLKRLMLRAADRVARDRGALAIATGDAIGQVSSQTLPNLAVISEATSLPILRPLVGLNKDEIIGRARDIGTYELSRVVREYCAMVPSKPATAATPAAVHAQEARLDGALLDRVVAERGVFDLRALELDKFDLPELEVREIPEGATLIDLRNKAAFQSWHHPGALFLDFGAALRAYPSFERGRSYVLYCEFGLKSAHLAELMRREGFEAYHFRGGLPDLLRYCRKRGSAVPDLPAHPDQASGLV